MNEGSYDRMLPETPYVSGLKVAASVFSVILVSCVWIRFILEFRLLQVKKRVAKGSSPCPLCIPCSFRLKSNKCCFCANAFCGKGRNLLDSFHVHPKASFYLFYR